MQSFSVYILEIEEVENYIMNVSNMVEYCLIFLHQNDSFALFGGKFCLKIGMHMNFHFIAASWLLQQIWRQAHAVFIIT